MGLLHGLRSPELTVADATTNTMARKIGPFSHGIRPFTVNGKQTLVFVNVNELLGFEIGDLISGKKLHRVEVTGFEKGPVKRHGCPSHGIGLTPDEKEVWVCDAFNQKLHIFDATVMPPKQVASIGVRDQPGWITFSIDGQWAYPSTGEIINVKSRSITTSLAERKRVAGSQRKSSRGSFREWPTRGCGRSIRCRESPIADRGRFGVSDKRTRPQRRGRKGRREHREDWERRIEAH